MLLINWRYGVIMEHFRVWIVSIINMFENTRSMFLAEYEGVKVRQCWAERFNRKLFNMIRNQVNEEHTD